MKKLERTGPAALDRQKAKLERLERPPRGMQWPDFGAMFDPDALNPLDGMELTDDIEANAVTESELVERSFLDNNRPADDPYRVMLDPEFYVVICFQSRQQKDEFLEKSGFAEKSLGDKYLDGLKVARHMGIDVAPIPLPAKKPRTMPRLLRDIKTLQRGGDS